MTTISMLNCVGCRMAAGYEAGLKKEVARALRGRISAPEWARLVDSKLVSTALDDLEASDNLGVLGTLVPQGDDWATRCRGNGAGEVVRLVHAIEFMRAERGQQGKKVHQPEPAPQAAAAGTGRQYTPIALTDEEQAQTLALSALTAARASKSANVLGFRERYLGGHQHPIRSLGGRTASGHSVYLTQLHDLTQRRCPGGHVLSDREALRFLRSPALACYGLPPK